MQFDSEQGNKQYRDHKKRDTIIKEAMKVKGCFIIILNARNKLNGMK